MRSHAHWLVLALLFSAFVLWYGGSGSPMTPEEADSLIARIEEQMEARDRIDQHLLDAFRTLASQDDGDEFLMVNLMKFREQAVYPPGYEYDDDALAAADRYSAAVFPQLLRRGSLPILLANPTGTFLDFEGAERWDQVGIVRYRSRRDMLEMALALARGDGAVHKWASLEKTHVFPADSVIDFVFVRGLVAVILLALGGLVHLGLRRRALSR